MKQHYIELSALVQQAEAQLRFGYQVAFKKTEIDHTSQPVIEPSTNTKPDSKTRPTTGNETITDKLKGLLELNAAEAIDRLHAVARTCTACDLCKNRNRVVPGAGSHKPLIMVLADAPGPDEDRLGIPLVDTAGQFFDKWLDSIDSTRYRNAYLTTLVKCRPPENRGLDDREIAQCVVYLEAQLAILKPKVLLVIGPQAAGWLFGSSFSIDENHGKVFDFRGIPWMPLYPPVTVLRDAALKRPLWEDLKNFRKQFVGGSHT